MRLARPSVSVKLSACLILPLLSCPQTCAQEFWPDLAHVSPAQGGGEKDAAVVVGIEKYVFFDRVYGARENADAWQSYLTGTLNIPAEHVALLKDEDASVEQMRRSAAAAVKEVGAGGRVWFIFIGNGAPSKDGRDAMLVGMDARQTADSVIARSMSRNALLRTLAGGKQSKTIVVIDASFNGKSSSGRDLVEGLQPLVTMYPLSVSSDGVDHRLVLLTAAKPDQFSGPLPKASRVRPAFSYLALGALRGWAADKSGKVTAGAVIDFARKALRLAHDHAQVPQLEAGSPDNLLVWGHELSPNFQGIDRPVKTPDQAGIEWVPIPGGAFLMGCDSCKAAQPAHRVAVQAFEIAKTPVTNRQYQGCVDAGACERPRPQSECFPRDGIDFSLLRKPDEPVVCVDWNQARTFSKWVGGRLPSEAEWEFASRSAGADSMYPWGTAAPNCEVAGLAACGLKSTLPVCSRPKGNTRQGLCDMVGNVSEWVEDYYHKSYADAPADGRAWEDYGFYRITRGRSWLFGSSATSPGGDRNPGIPSSAISSIGFRPVR